MRKFGDSIDKELPNYLTYIVDEKLELVSIGSEGEFVGIVRIF